jgi:hypothetical protein
MNRFKLSAVRLHIPCVLLCWLPDQNFICSFHVFISCCTFLTPLFSFYKGPAEVLFLHTVFLSKAHWKFKFLPPYITYHIFVIKPYLLLAITFLLGWNFTQRISKWNIFAFFLTYRIWCRATNDNELFLITMLHHTFFLLFLAAVLYGGNAYKWVI